MQKKLSEITRDEWIAFNWVDISEMGDGEDPMMITHTRRTPDEAHAAMQDWDITAYQRMGINFED